MISALIGVAILLVGRRPRGHDLARITLGALIFINAMALTYLPLLIERAPQIGAFNWLGKSVSLVYLLLAVVVLPSDWRRSLQLWAWPDRSKHRSTLIGLLLFALLGTGLAFTGIGDADPIETAAFQLTLPSLTEEILFRSLLLVLWGGVGLASAVRYPTSFGRSAVASSVLFGLVHGFLFSPSSGFIFDPVALIATGIFGAGFAWLAIQSRSLLPAVIAHSFVNGTGPVMHLLGLV